MQMKPANWQDVCTKIDQLDLDPIKVKLMDPDEGYCWTREQADHIEAQYRQFLKLSALQNSSVVPTKVIDTFWHAHILDTHKYAEDCDHVFGYFLHHFPYFGMRGEVDRKNLEQAYSETLQLVRDLFGVEASWGKSDAQSSICSSCGTSDCAPTPSCSSVTPFSEVIDINTRPALAA
jgi:hypothetical protein